MKYVYNYLQQLRIFSGKSLYLNLIGISMVSLIQGLEIFLLLPLLSLSGIIDVNMGGSIISSAFSFLQTFPVTLGLPLILTIYLVIMVFHNLLNRYLTIQNTKILFRFVHHVRIEAYQELLNAKWDIFVKKRKSDLLNTLTTELNRVIVGLKLALQFSTSLVFTIVQIFLALWISPKMTVLVLVCGIVLSFFARKFTSRSHALGNRTIELSREYLGGITDQLNGIKDIKSNTLEESRIKWLRSLTEKMFDEQVAYTKLKTTSQLFYKLALTCLLALFIFISVNLFQTQPEQFILVIVIFSRLWPRIMNIQSSIEQISSSIPAFKSFTELREECRNNSEHLPSIVLKENTSLHINNEIECQNVYFRYSNYDYALEDINVNIPINSLTAFVGQSGAGKSTLIDLLMGLNHPEKGDVLIDGVPLKRNDFLSLRKSVSYVPQDPFLFHDTIRNNLLLVQPDANEKQIWEALEFSSAAEFVSRFPNGLDTLIGDRGIKLSGGERQRLVLARAILRKPSILVLDEATSALDSENEFQIQKALETLKGKMTIIVIAHRLSTIRNADQVIVLDGGKVIQQGAFNQLASEEKGMFSTLLRKQLKMVH